MKNMKSLEFNFLKMKIMKTVEYHKRINTKNANHKIPCENHENHKKIIKFHIIKIKIMKKI